MPSDSAPRTSRGNRLSGGPAADCKARSPTCGPLPWVTTTLWPSPIRAAIAAAARRTLVRWTAALMVSPRRRSALPPRAATIFTTSPRDRRHQNRLDRMHAVLGLIEDDRGARLEDLVGHLHTVDAEALGG